MVGAVVVVSGVAAGGVRSTQTRRWSELVGGSPATRAASGSSVGGPEHAGVDDVEVRRRAGRSRCAGCPVPGRRRSRRCRAPGRPAGWRWPRPAARRPRAPPSLVGSGSCTASRSSSCWIAPSTESPSTGSALRSPTMTNSASASRPPATPASSTIHARVVAGDVVGPEADLVGVAQPVAVLRHRRTSAPSAATPARGRSGRRRRSGRPSATSTTAAAPPARRRVYQSAGSGVAGSSGRRASGIDAHSRCWNVRT